MAGNDFIKTYRTEPSTRNELEKAITGTDFPGNKRGLDVSIAGGTAAFTPSGLKTAGRVTMVTVDETQWWPFPATALTARNACVIQNLSGADILVNYSAAAPAADGISVLNGYERQYDITEAITIYVRRKSGSGIVIVACEELS